MSTATGTIPTDNQSSPEISQKVFAAQVQQTYTQMILGGITNPIGALVVVVVLWPVIPQGSLVLWFATMLLIQLARLILPLRYRSIEATPQAVTTWSRLQILINGMSGLAWGITFFVLWPAGMPQYQLILPVIIIALSAASTAGYAPIRASHLSHVLLSQVPFVIRFFAEGTTVHVSLALLDIMYILTLYRVGQNLRRASTEALTTSFRNEELAAKLAEEKSKIETLNIQLQESEERFRGLSEATYEGVAIHDNGVIVDVNQAAIQMLGYTESEAIGMHISDLLLPESHEVAVSHMQTDYEKPYEVQGVRKDKSVLPIEVQGKTVPYKGKVARVVAVRDLTSRKQAEEQALKLQLEHERVQILTRFFQDASHEFRTPLAVIKMSTYLVDHATTSGQRQENLDQINGQADRITALVDGLLLMVRLDSEIELERRPTNVNDLLRSIWEELHEAFPDKCLALTFDLHEALPLLQVDSDLLRQALYALLHNAGRFVADNGSITLTTSLHDDHLHLVIEDDGIGIDAEAMPHIFDRFYRADEAHSTAGFGLGLPIARQIIMLHGGEIAVESQLGEGARFTVSLPVEHKFGEDELVITKQKC